MCCEQAKKELFRKTLKQHVLQYDYLSFNYNPFVETIQSNVLCSDDILSKPDTVFTFLLVSFRKFTTLGGQWPAHFKTQSLTLSVCTRTIICPLMTLHVLIVQASGSLLVKSFQQLSIKTNESSVTFSSFF